MKIIHILCYLLIAILLLGSPTSYAGGNEGFIYGKVITKEKKEYLGIIRWEKQEYFWDDHFNATKNANIWTEYYDEIGRKEIEKNIIIMGFPVKHSIGNIHQFVVRFGDIDKIIVIDDSEANIVMKGGTEFEVYGYGDIGATLLVQDQSVGKIKLNWDKIKRIEFMNTPANVLRPGDRMFGVVKTWNRDFKGFVMWDAEECISTDILDGESSEGDMEIEFGNIKSIKKHGMDKSIVTLKDGRTFNLEGTNDVDEGNRGIYIEDERYGKAVVPWGEFVEVNYEPNSGTGLSYSDFSYSGKLNGTVSTYKDEQVSGELVFDLDENEKYEILDGKISGISFYIPFNKIATIQPLGRRSSKVTLINGEELTLEDEQDVNSSNDGVLVFIDKNKRKYLDWNEVKTIRFNNK
jgi:hypothetical protein